MAWSLGIGAGRGCAYFERLVATLCKFPGGPSAAIEETRTMN